jgi:hypothetical protein
MHDYLRLAGHHLGKQSQRVVNIERMARERRGRRERVA